MDHNACISLGANIDPARNLIRAREELIRELELLRSSSIWESPAYGAEGPNFLNAAVLARCSHSAEELKWGVLRDLETRMGRVRTEDKYAPRPIDLDVVVFDGEVIDEGLWTLSFLAAPCAELLPGLVDPSTGLSLAETAAILTSRQTINRRYRSFQDLEGLNSPAG